jgi:transposase-like protein
VIELDGAFIGGKRAGRRGRGAAGKTPVIVACGHNDGKPGFVALQAVEGINLDTVKQFAQAHLAVQQTIHTDAFKALDSLGESRHHVAKVTPPEWAAVWSPWVHIVISDFKAFVLGAYNGISGEYVQEYLNEYADRLNRRLWETEMPNRLLRLAVNHRQVIFQPVICS